MYSNDIKHSCVLTSISISILSLIYIYLSGYIHLSLHNHGINQIMNEAAGGEAHAEEPEVVEAAVVAVPQLHAQEGLLVHHHHHEEAVQPPQPAWASSSPKQ